MSGQNQDRDAIKYVLIPGLAVSGFYTVSSALISSVSCAELDYVTKPFMDNNKNLSLNEYVSAMSDEELESALTKFGLLEKEENKKNIIK